MGHRGVWNIRNDLYKKDLSNRVRPDNTVFDIAVKNADGNTTYVKKSACESEVKSILPKELSRYFFFDGERIEKMSKEVADGKKATGFADAVKGLLGLNGMYSAILHFNPRTKWGVIGSFKASYNSQSNLKIKEYTDTIDRCKTKISQIEAELKELDSNIKTAQSRRDEKFIEIKQYEEGEKLQREREKLIEKIGSARKTKANVRKMITAGFNDGLRSFCSIALTNRALEFLSKKDFAGKDIPYIHAKTIEYLLKQRICLCGTHLDEGTLPYSKVKELIDYLPPQSISATIGDFKKEARNRAVNNKDILELINSHMAVISRQNDDLDDFNDELSRVEKKLSGGDVREKVRDINRDIKMCGDIIYNDGKKKERLIAEKARAEYEMSRADSERGKLTLLDDANKKIEIYKTYAEKIYSKLLDKYKKSEKDTRERLQETINDLFKYIYNGGLELEIDENYHISVKVTDFNEKKRRNINGTKYFRYFCVYCRSYKDRTR